MTVQNMTRNGRTFVVDTSTYSPKFWEGYETWERDTIVALDRFVSKDTLFLDVGAWIGPVSLYAGQTAARVVAFEPDPRAFANLARNFSLNEGLRRRSFLYNIGLWTSTGLSSITSTDLGNSQSSLVASDEAFRAKAAPIVTFDGEQMLREVCGNATDVFCKMDIEGAEYELVPHMRRFFEDYRPTFLLSLHPHVLGVEGEELLGKTNELLDTLSGYSHVYRYTNADMRPLDDVRGFLAESIQSGSPFQSALLFAMR